MAMIRCAVFLLCFAGCALLLRLEIPRLPGPDDLRAAYARLLKRLESLRDRGTLRQKIDRAQGKSKENFFTKNLGDARRILLSTNQQGKIRLLTRMSALCFAVGAAAALAMRNILMLPVLSVGFSLIPMWYVKYSEVYFKKTLCNELEVALSVVTSSYLRTDNLLRSVEENLAYMNEPVRQSFSQFVNQVKFVDANVQNGVRNLKASIQNPVFHDWCDILLLCVSDRTYKQSLLPVVEQFSDNKALQNSLETIIQQPVREFNMIALMAVGMVPLIYMMNKEWFFTLVGTWGGKAILTVLSLGIFVGFNKAIGLSSPIE